MSDTIKKINLNEVTYFYKSPYALVDFSNMQSFSLIKSTIEIFAYYNINDFTADDVRELFVNLQLIQKKNNKVFIPSPKKISGVLDCCLSGSMNVLSSDNGIYHIVSWDSSGYGYEISAAKQTGKLQ